MSNSFLFVVRDSEISKGLKVYVHHLKDALAASDLLYTAREFAWPLPRFEATEFAAALVRAAKQEAGGVRILNDEVEFRGQDQTIIVESARNRDGGVYIRVTAYDGTPEEHNQVFRGATGGFVKWAEEERRAHAPCAACGRPR